MANALYRRIEIGARLCRCRKNSYNEELCKQDALARILSTTQKHISNIENGYAEPDLKLAAKWCRVTGHYEEWLVIKNMYDLDVFSVPPIHFEFNQSFSSTIENLRKQLKEAVEALDEISKIWNARRPGKGADVDRMIVYSKEQFDLIPAIESFFFAGEREAHMNPEEVARIWTQEALAKGITMPRMDELSGNNLLVTT
ncbi:helix-turn-helix domain-containing protein [Aneurinibacillus terranovensis]|uniref:helix-turn-helix domain-containing protein n=1 Tax=Aneurinibacillus terranovensis TaxID=278991 RepID=UPI00041971CF|nr:helix-turn-helix transcriptional regulator [Aneurinibacillus terranovensis]